MEQSAMQEQGMWLKCVALACHNSLHACCEVAMEEESWVLMVRGEKGLINTVEPEYMIVYRR